ncbi:DUF2125 domain-containing protein [Neorhizobium lilium]|uniref:DUF2125 domain-containing protein n=1 Tax=Neorhizobium lilium TaxID=2503024 RepID=A0A444L9Z6_9HYPH|nr:DUF2125 domain-containing protein [Neorhizobium lilium]RWX74399.1 DUF2125 domain-containing protein [Neorhizobium lilium]
MAASSRTGVSGKLWLLACLVVLFIALYTAGWFYAASLLREKTLAMLGSRASDGFAAECADADYRGYPFRIGLFCSKVSVDDRANGISASFGALRSAAQVYDPGHIVWEMDSPAELRSSRGLIVSTSWKSLQSSVVTKLKGVERAALVLQNPKTHIVSSANGQSFDINADRAEIHLRQNGPDLDAAVTLDGTDTAMEGLQQLLPRLTTSADLTLVGRAGMIDGSDPNGISLRQTKGEMREFRADLGEGRVLLLSGPFSFDDEGRMSGKLKLRVEKLAAWQESLSQAFPDLGPMLQTATSMLSALGGGANASLDITIKRGKILAGGLIPIGEIPPV